MILSMGQVMSGEAGEATGPPFLDQVSTNVYLGSVFYTVCTVAIIWGILGSTLVDSAIVRRINRVDNWVQKIIGSLIAAGAFLVIGYAIWIWQYYDAFGAAEPFRDAIRDWWFAGEKMTNVAQKFNQAATGTFNLEVDVFQVFVGFFITFIMFGATLLHSAGLERLKARAYYVMVFFLGGLVMPLVLYLTWGSASPLTNRGVHDYVGLFALYITVGTWSVILSWRLKPRLGAFEPHPRTKGPQVTDLSKAGMGVFLLLSAIPFIALGCGFLIPGAGYFGISMTNSSLGLSLINIFAAYIGGGIMGGILAYRTKNVFWAILGPLSGYISGTALFDITRPWVMFLVALGGPIMAYLTYNLLHRIGIDEPKVAPLVLGPGIYAALVAGIVEWGTRTGGFLGFPPESKFAFGGAEINLWWQAIGLGVTLAIAIVSGLIVIIGCEKTIGIRVDEDSEIAGLDNSYWGLPQD